MTISVMITTRNRSAELRRTCRVLRDLNQAPLEILITVDGCTDDTVEVLKSELPNAKLMLNETGRDTVLISPIVTIRHHFSGEVRSEVRNHHRHARNELWSTLLRCPFPFAIGMAGWRVFSQLRYACKRGWSWVVREPLWWGRALAGT